MSTNKVSNKSLALHLLILRKKNQFFIGNFHRKFIFLIKIFILFFCQQIFSVSTNEVSNEILSYPLSILVKKNFKKLNDDENEKNRKSLGGGTLCLNF